jgi:hypothetical protein
MEVATDKWKPLWPVGVAGGTQALTTQQLIAQRVRVTSPIKGMAFEVAAAAAGGFIQLGVYDDSAYPRPGVLIQQSANIATDVAAYKTFAFSATLPPGVYWFATQNTGGVTVSGRTFSPQNPYHPGSTTLTGTGGSVHSSLLAGGQGANLPATFPAASDFVAIGMQMQGG